VVDEESPARGFVRIYLVRDVSYANIDIGTNCAHNPPHPSAYSAALRGIHLPRWGMLRLDLRPNLAHSILRSALSLATFLFDPRGAKRKVNKGETRFLGDALLPLYSATLRGTNKFVQKSSAKTFLCVDGLFVRGSLC